MDKNITEEWRPIPGHANYIVSNLGNIKSIAICKYVHGKFVVIHRVKDITPTDNGNGYMIFGIGGGSGKKQNMYVHRAVALAFIPKPEGKDFINHLDYDRSNNAVWNLEWCTRKENMQYSRARMSHPRPSAPISATGIRYIGIDSKGRYRVNIHGTKIDRRFRNLDDAKAFRDSVIKGTIYEKYYPTRS